MTHVSRCPYLLRLTRSGVRRGLRKHERDALDHGQDFADDAIFGTVVSVHWNWAYDVLSRTKLERLKRYTQRYIAFANETI